MVHMSIYYTKPYSVILFTYKRAIHFSFIYIPWAGEWDIAPAVMHLPAAQRTGRPTPNSSIYKYTRTRWRRGAQHIWCNIIHTERSILNGFSMSWSDGYDLLLLWAVKLLTYLPDVCTDIAWYIIEFKEGRMWITGNSGNAHNYVVFVGTNTYYANTQLSILCVFRQKL